MALATVEAATTTPPRARDLQPEIRLFHILFKHKGNTYKCEPSLYIKGGT